MTHIFLSYRSIEAEFALKLAADLKNAGVRLWMDRLDGGIGVGMDWRGAIEGALNSCAALIAVLSPDYVQATYCKNELARADRLQRPIFPVLLRNVAADKWPLEIERTQYEDFTDWFGRRDEREYRRRLDRLIARIRDRAGAQVGDTPDAETRYLTSLISELEAARGVMQYVALAGQMDRPQEVRPQPPPIDEWGYAELIAPTSRSDESDDLDEFDPRHMPREQEQIPFKSIAEAVDKHPRFVLIGDPGAGKTTTIRRLALEAARRRLDNPRTAPLPLLLYLPRWGEERTPAEFVRAHWPLTGDDPAAMLARGDIRLYLDGLNEMGARGSQRTKWLTAWFKSENAPQHAIVTCRTGDYAGDLRLGDTPTVLVQELGESQIRQFAANYLGDDDAAGFLEKVLLEKGNWYESGWEREKRESRSLFRLARNPYMLSALLIVYEHGGDLPRNTGALFHGLIRALWKREEYRGTTGDISFEEAESAFARLAFAMIDEDMSIDVPVDWALRRLDVEQPEILLRIGVNANYITVSGEQVRFFHQLMQETFAALELGRVGLVGRVKPPEFIRWRAERKTQKWDQVVIALCGVGDAESTITAVAEIDPFLAYECIESGIEAGHVRVAVVDSLLVALGNEDWNGGASAALVKTGTLAVEPLIAALHDESGTVRESAVRTLGQISDARAVEPLIAALRDENEEVRERAVIELSWIGDARAIEPLIAALRHGRSHIRQYAAGGLGQIGDARAVEPLIAALCDEYEGVRWYAARALGQIGDARAVEPLIALLSDNTYTSIIPRRVCNYAADALKEIGTPEALAAVEMWTPPERYTFDFDDFDEF